MADARVDVRGAQSAAQQARRSLLTTGLILGIGIAGTLDEVILHQLLQWHHFYSPTTPYWQIVSDGLFHLASSTLLVWGALRLWSDRARLSAYGNGRTLAAGILLGSGGFNLFDGTVNHHVLRVHQVRDGVANTLPYDIVFIAIALIIFLLGWRLWRTTA